MSSLGLAALALVLVIAYADDMQLKKTRDTASTVLAFVVLWMVGEIVVVLVRWLVER